MRKRFKLLIILGLLLSQTKVFASFDLEKKGSIKVNTVLNETKVNNLKVNLFKLGNAYIEDNNLEFKLLDKFEGDYMSDDFTDKIGEFILENEIEVDKTLVSTDGSVLFDDLDAGLYLVSLDETHLEYVFKPFVISVPYTEDDVWVYEVEASPKLEHGPIEIPDTDDDLVSDEDIVPPLIQTGLLLWPIALMAFVGFVLVLFGIRDIAMKHRKGLGLIIIGSLLILASIVILVHNKYEDYMAGKKSKEVYLEMLETIEEEKSEIIQMDGDTFIGFLDIPRFDLKLPIYEHFGVDRLKIAPIRQYGTYRKDNLVIAGHNYENHFRDLWDILAGDKIYLTNGLDETIEYEVIVKETIHPSASNLVKNSPFDLVLYTCTLGSANRVVVYANRV